MTSLQQMLAERPVLLADGATGTNFFDMGLTAGDPPEFWNVDHPDRVKALHSSFVEAGADIILTNSFGANRHRLKLHKAQDRVFELNKRAAELAREAAEQAGRPIVVAGSIGPTGELFQPLGELTEAEAVDAFREQAEGLKAGGADVAWIETMSAVEEMVAAAKGAIAAGLPYTVTASFDTAGRTMMGLAPSALPEIFGTLPVPPVAIGANCGVGASDLLVSVLAMAEAASPVPFIAKANAGIPQFRGEHIHYSGTPELMAQYARYAVDAGARIVGGCCGTTAVHLAAMRKALDEHSPGARPDHSMIEAAVGPLTSRPKADATPRRRGRRQ
ncbi:betaine--homocysteine S-methyltransferase [Propylenella binzhouense]|uniref:Betaine--homocysteine S-methyltransferase n=1 Tax=Propylenella binzhouense TaxID=2555902 RepID=A0A964T507_9HYPH|nr:betaine--homocysteine S-methyltransferase [Propylenella binzhouense]MYZ48032.1 betaine--homocysteine S-methyltransferase [Propylenella binzhouense]